jgi:hypothetical protein
MDEVGRFLMQLPMPIGPIVTGLLPVCDDRRVRRCILGAVQAPHEVDDRRPGGGRAEPAWCAFISAASAPI